jgi:hypothetical protein
MSDDEAVNMQVDGASQNNGRAAGDGAEGFEVMAEADVVDVNAGNAGAGRENTVRVTTKYMTKYERARVLGTRALQIR